MTPLLRRPVLWLTQRQLLHRLVTDSALGQRLASRFVAGGGFEEAMSVVRRLEERGIRATLDHLGENVESPSHAAAASDAYILALKRIREAGELGVNISVKLTQLGLDISRTLCTENLERVLQVAADGDRPILVMIDMEASAYVGPTLDVYLSLRNRLPNVGVCVQSYLHRTAADVVRIAGPGAVVRVCKGAYLEPPEVAFRRRSDVSRSFASVTATLLARGSTVHVATHDPKLIEGARRFVRTRGISSERYEFQMLYGVRRDLQSALVAEGEPVRVYVPYGTQWYPYLTRRLAERPANLWFFVSNLVRRGG